MYSSPALPRRSQCSIRSANNWHAQPAPPSRKPKRRSGKRRVTPPRNNDLATAWPAAAKWPMWLNVKLLAVLRRPRPRPPVWKAGDFRIHTFGARQWPPDAAAEHADLGAELLRDEFELLDRLLGGVHRDHRRRGQTVAEIAEVIGSDDVEAADHGAPGLVILDARDAQPRGRVNDAEIDPQLVEPVVEHARHHRGGAVAGVGR